jgi:hypothetical protein
MPRINEMVESKFLKKEDVEQGVLVTITAIEQHDVSMENKPTEMKWCATFNELAKPLVLNMTNMRALEAITGSDDSDHWIGRTIVLFNDPNVSYAGKITGGIRLRAPRNQQPQQPPVPPDAMDHMQQPHANDVPDDEIPF